MQTHRAGEVSVSFVLALRLGGILVISALLCEKVLFPEVLVGAVLVLDKLHTRCKELLIIKAQQCQSLPEQLCSRRSRRHLNPAAKADAPGLERVNLTHS